MDLKTLEHKMSWSMVRSFDEAMKTRRTSKQRQVALARHRLDYETTMVVAALNSRCNTRKKYDSFWSSERERIEKTLPASQDMSHFSRKKESLFTLGFAGRVSLALEQFLRCNYPLLPIMVKCAVRYADRIKKLWSIPREDARDIVRVALHIAVNAPDEDGAVIFGGRRYEIEGSALPQDQHAQLFHDIVQVKERLGVPDDILTVRKPYCAVDGRNQSLQKMTRLRMTERPGVRDNTPSVGTSFHAVEKTRYDSGYYQMDPGPPPSSYSMPRRLLGSRPHSRSSPPEPPPDDSRKTNLNSRPLWRYSTPKKEQDAEPPEHDACVSREVCDPRMTIPDASLLPPSQSSKQDTRSVEMYSLKSTKRLHDMRAPSLLDTQTDEQATSEPNVDSFRAWLSSSNDLLEVRRFSYIKRDIWASSLPIKQTDEQVTYEPEVLGLVGGTEVSCLPDKGAGCNFMSLQHAELHGIPVIPPDPKSRVTRLGNGKQVEIAGHATLPFSFKGEAESHQLEFVVLPRCIKDVILGSPFLRLTKLFERHAHRIIRKIRKFPGLQACYTASQERVMGMLDGELVHALPDTGSDVMLISETYAKRRGLHINYDSHYCFPLTFADGSQSWTSGMAKDVSWQYGTEGGTTTLCDFYVLKDLQCDVLLSYDFLHRTEAFSLHERWMSLSDDATDFANTTSSEWILSTITRNSAQSSDSDSYLKRLRRKLHSGGKQANPAVAPCQADPAADSWDREHRRLLRNLQTIDEQMQKLPSGPLQDDARVALEVAKATFTQHMASRPGVPATPTGAPSSSSSSTTATSNTGS